MTTQVIPQPPAGGAAHAKEPGDGTAEGALRGKGDGQNPVNRPAGGPTGWLLLHADDVSERWRERAQQMLLVPLLDGEAADILDGGQARSLIAPEDQRLACLIASGATTRMIAGQLRLSPRTIERRIAALRRRVGATSRPQLQVALARLGF